MNQKIDLKSSSNPMNGVIWVWMALLVLVLLLRVLSLPLAPLTDHTEARYAEIARLMLESGDWISPHITPTEVFWAKPPLSTWSQAALMALFGVNEWSGRLAAVLWSLVTLSALAWMLKPSLPPLQRWAALTVLMLCPLFFLCAGAVMTDAALAATVMWVQAAWWRAVTAETAAAQRRAGRWLALGVGLALLTKGIAAVALAVLPILMHALWRGHWPQVWRILKDPLAWLIAMAVALPWYVAAEIKTPGFLEYFVLGEHVMRFIQPGWKGDRYGFAHAQPLGMIWLYFLVATLPWLVLALLRGGWLGWRRRPAAAWLDIRERLGPDLAAYALCMVLAPLLLFSAARNIITTYALTAVPGFVILFIGLWSPDAWRRRGLVGMALGVAALMAWAFFSKLPQVAEANTDRGIWQAYGRACAGGDCSLRYIDDQPPYSVQFYSRGRLYTPMPIGDPVAGHRVFEVRRASDELKRQALACNKAGCLLEVTPGPAATVAPQQP